MAPASAPDGVTEATIGRAPRLELRTRLRRTVRDLYRVTDLPVAFGGPVVGGGVLLAESAGMTTGALDGLVVARGSGLGGRAVQLARPVAVHNYQAAQVISHDYDRQIATEGLVSLIAVPVSVRRRVRAVLYGALRQPSAIGDRVVDEVVTAAQRLGQAVDADDTRRAMAARSVAISARNDTTPDERAELQQIFAELRCVAAGLADDAARTALLGHCDRFVLLSTGQTLDPAPELTRRELDALALAAVGCGNGEIAELLSVELHVVKTYLRAVMQKLGARTRHATVSAARLRGLLP